MTPEERFSALVASDPTRPFVTYYDEATGERAELSVRSLANWVAKTHSLLVDELGLGVGDRAVVDVPAHWISVPIVLGCLTAGLALTVEPDPSAEVAFVAAGAPAALAGIPDVFAVEPAAAAMGFRDGVPPGTQDYVHAVRPQPDAWAGVGLAAGAADPCLPGLTRVEADEAGQSRAAELGLTAGGRLLTSREWTSPTDWIEALLAPLAVSGSVVIVRNARPDVLDRRAVQERCTARAVAS